MESFFTVFKQEKDWLLAIILNILYSTLKLLTKCCTILTVSDINECHAKWNDCHELADCINIDGSYECVCKEGTTGDGSSCEGKF